MRHLAPVALIGITLVVASAPGLAADPGADLNRAVRDYRAAEQRLPRDPDLKRGDDGTELYDESGATAQIAARQRINQSARASLDKLDPADMRPQDRLTYATFRWWLDDEQRELQPGLDQLSDLLPLSQFDGPQVNLPRQLQWRAEAPWKRPRDYDDGIRRMLNFSRWADTAIVRMREGLKRGDVQSRAVVERVIAQLGMFATSDPENSPFMQPVKNISGSITGRDRARVTDAWHSAVSDELIPAYRKLADFLKNEYLPHAPDAPGLAGIPGGKELYRYLVANQTTTDLSPDEIHAIGLKELDRIGQEMAQAKDAAGFHGTIAEFRHYLQTDPKFKFKDRDAMLAEFQRVQHAVSDHLSDVFESEPAIPLTFRFYDSYAAPDKPAAEYAPGSADGKRPGTVYLNDWDLPERPTYTSEVLELHEGIPGHHLQVSLAMENSGPSRARRFGEETAFVEGWALYAETLGPEFGLYKDPYQKFGALSFDAWRASRLVVDTGIHWLGWSREQSVQFLTSHTALSRTEAEEEIDRYTVMPAQALAYKIGEREFLDLRDRAKSALGNKFDLKRFHEALLKDGALPMPVLDQKMTRWLAAEKSAG
jgi:uncharacterized protein (DUF885 family)